MPIFIVCFVSECHVLAAVVIVPPKIVKPYDWWLWTHH